MSRFRDAAHLIRLASVLMLGAMVFVALRAAVIPKSFGRYGPYRGDALQEITSRPLRYGGHETCEGCHPDILEVKSKGVHARVNCESCHGPQAKHANDPGSLKPPRPEVARLCVRCHSENVAKPSGFLQVDHKEHAQGESCGTCHQPHSPGFDSGGKK